MFLFAGAGSNCQPERMPSVKLAALKVNFRFTALGWYFDRVLPKEYGVRLSPTFVFRRSFWQSIWRPLASMLNAP